MNTMQMFSHVFPPDGWNKDTHALNRDPSHSVVVKDAFRFSRLTQAAVFLGLPHRLLDPAQKQSVLNIVKNFFGWRDTVTPFKNIITMPFMTAMNIVLTPLKLLINIAKVGTEFIPFYLEQKIVAASDYFHAAAEARDGVTSASLYLLAGTLYLGSLPFSGAFILGRAITSPNSSARIAMGYGTRFGNTLMNNHSPQNTVLGKIFGLTAGAISLGISVTLYALVLPLGLQFIGAKVLPHLPGAISSFIDSAGSALAPFFNVMAKITQFCSFDLSAVAVASYSNAAIAIAGMTAIATTTLGYQARELSSKFKAWWHLPSEDFHELTDVDSEEEETELDYEDEDEDEVEEEEEEDDHQKRYEAEAAERLKFSRHQQHQQLVESLRRGQQYPAGSDLGTASPPSSPKAFGPDVAFTRGQQPKTSPLRKGSVFKADTQAGVTEVEQQATAGNRM